MHPIERIARFHLEFEGIHPFIDGNGRTGRLLLNLELIRNGYPAINVKFADRKRYYDAFDVFYRDGNAGDMVLLVSEYVKERLDTYLEILKDKSAGGKAVAPQALVSLLRANGQFLTQPKSNFGKL